MKHIWLIFVAVCFLETFNAGAGAPTILSPPLSVTVNNASDAAITVVALNAAAYQWQWQGASLSGATNATLSLENVTSNQAGSYTVIVTSPDNLSITSAPPAVLTVVPGTIVQVTLSTFPNGAGSNVVVQLFDHDKPATVENFIHYITAGAYSNMFFDRDIPGFVLQGGDYDAADRTHSSVQVYSIYESYTENLGFNPPFPWQVDNEFGVGPVVHNTFGTVAMAKEAGNPDSAANAFYFNLADNSANLDNQNGGYTVFGRVLSGSNVLEYFSGLSKPSGGIFDSGGEAFTDLPVNFNGAAAPGNSNLFFADFAFLTRPPIDTTPPTVSISFPVSNAVVSAGSQLSITGTASDNIGLARVVCNLFDSFGYDNGVFGGNAVGTTNWSYLLGNIPPGSYNTYIVSQDGAGNLSSPAEISFTVVSPPALAGISLSGANLSFTATNGVTNGQFVLLTTTNLATPIKQWTPVLTNNFDANGRAVFTSAMNPSLSRQYYLLSE
jgi:cyclophilin family peptidyl-prolyl cis-trans isomerase